MCSRAGDQPIIGMTKPYKLLTVEASYYGAKIQAYLDYKRIAYEPVLATREAYEAEIIPRVGWPVVPIVITPDDKTLQDTSEIIDELEARFSQTPVIPDGNCGRPLCLWLELLADEWLKLPAMHYRWNYNREFIVQEFGRNNDPELAPARQREIGEKIAPRFEHWLPDIGVTAASQATVEADYLELLGLLDRHFTQHKFLLGSAPSLGDFAWYGPLYAHLYRDPASGEILRQHAPALERWILRLKAVPKSASQPPPAHVPDTLLAPLRLLARDFVPLLVNEAIALQRWLADQTGDQPLPRHFGEHTVALGRNTNRLVSVTRKLFTYNQWMLQRLIDACAAASNRGEVEDEFNRIDADKLLRIALSERLVRRDFQLYRVADSSTSD